MKRSREPSRFVYFVGNDSDDPVRAHEDELGSGNLLYQLAIRRSDESSHVPVSCSRDVLRSIIATLRTGEVMLLGDTNLDEYLETARATTIMTNPYNKVFDLDSSSLTQFLAINGFNTTVTTDANAHAIIERRVQRTRKLWEQLAFSIWNWPTLRRAMRACRMQGTPVSTHVAPSAARIHINTAINEQGKHHILRSICERIATHRTSRAAQNESDLLELFADEAFIDDFNKSIMNTPYGPFWFIMHEYSERRKIGIDKVIRRLAARIMNEPTTDLEEPSKIATAILRIRKLWEDLCGAVPRIESYFGLCEHEPTDDIRLLHEVFRQFGLKLVTFERVRRTMDTSQLLTFPISDIQLDSIDAVVVIHFVQETTQPRTETRGPRDARVSGPSSDGVCKGARGDACGETCGET